MNRMMAENDLDEVSGTNPLEMGNCKTAPMAELSRAAAGRTIKIPPKFCVAGELARRERPASRPATRNKKPPPVDSGRR
jgi:hypothetical protein